MIGQFSELFGIGLNPIPLIWDEETKNAASHVIPHGDINDQNKGEYNMARFNTMVKSWDRINGVGLKLFSPFGMIDFDLKNTDDKEVFNRWKFAVNSQNEEILGKVCFETTRNNGYHVYIKYPKLKSKVSLANESNGKEVIALYTGGTLAYCDPTPGYNMIWNSFDDLQELTDDEFSILISTAESFNKAENFKGYESEDTKVVNGRVMVSYPTEYENTCIQFDRNVTDEVFDSMLSDMTLHPCKDYKYGKKDKYRAYLREGSKANKSAKVYYESRRVLLFTSSLPDYPSYMDRVSNDDHAWVLTPSKILYYKNDRDWISTIEEIKMICDSADIMIEEQIPVTNAEVIKPDRLKFPADVFPETVQRFLSVQRIQYEYLAAGVLGVISTAIGNNSTLLANGGYDVKGIIYLAIVAPPGASKSPALKATFKPLEMIDSKSYKKYKEEYKEYKESLAAYKNAKDKSFLREPNPPDLMQTIIKDSTIEKLITILSVNPNGCVLLADELSGFLARMNQYKSGDELQKWLEMWSGSPIMVQRVSREADKVESPYCTIVGGIQPGVLESLSSKENEHNGFYHRFLFVYPDPMPKLNWEHHDIDQGIVNDYYQFVFDLVRKRHQENKYILSKEAGILYKEWFDNKNKKYNKATNDNYRGIIAKYQDYCLRFSLIIQVAYDCDSKDWNNIEISGTNMERAIRLTEYFFGNMNKSIKILAPESPLDKLSEVHRKLYDMLPPAFSMKTGKDAAEKAGIKYTNFKVLLGRWSKSKDPILNKISAGEYEKIY